MEREPITGVWVRRAGSRGRAPGRGVRAKPPEAESFEAIVRRKAQNLLPNRQYRLIFTV